MKKLWVTPQISEIKISVTEHNGNNQGGANGKTSPIGVDNHNYSKGGS